MKVPAIVKAGMPVWLSDSEIDPSWIQEKMPSFKDVAKCVVRDISNDTRKGAETNEGATLLLTLTTSRRNNDDDTKKEESVSSSLVAKQVSQNALSLSQRLGLAREALFYNTLAPKIKINGKDSDQCSSIIIPAIYYSSGDMSDGSKIVVMEDLSRGFVDSGILFGPGNPNNWKRDLKSKIAEAYPSRVPTSFEVANQTFLAVANVHAAFWRDQKLLNGDYDWLRGSSWIRGENEASWKASQGMIQTMWERYALSNSKNNNKDGIQWDPLVREIVEKAVKGISWEAQRQRLNETTHFSLVHGDFWPGNVMISKERRQGGTAAAARDDRELRLLDWEMVGLGSGPQDLGQYILSNMDPSERRGCEERLVRNYYRKLVVELGIKNLAWEECWTEYKIGGLERWLWFLVYFCAQPATKEWAQFFHNQIKEFVHDHGISPEDVTQPRP